MRRARPSDVGSGGPHGRPTTTTLIPSTTSTSTTAVPPVFVATQPGLYVVGADGSGAHRVGGGSGLFAWSPDGSRIALGDGGPLRIIRADGSGEITLAGAPRALAPAWSLDGSRIAFDGGSTGAYVVAADGSSPAKLADPLGQMVAWTPDSRLVVITSPPTGFSSVVLYDGHGGRRVLAADANKVVPPAPSPDGRLVAYLSNRILVAAVSGSGSHPLTPMCCASESASSPLRWSPDGRQLAFIDRGDVEVVGADGSGPRVLVPHATNPSWSPDGRELVVIDQSSKRPDGLIHESVVVVAADGSGGRTVFDVTGKVDAAMAQWSPDGRQLAVLVTPGFTPP